MGGNYFVLILVLTPYLCSALEVMTVYREINDKIQYDLKACFNHSTKISSMPVVCRCYTNHSTIMSGIGKTYLCGAPSEVGCKYSLEGSNQTYLIKNGGNFMKKITPSLPKIDRHMQIFIWNYLYNGHTTGTWHNITKEASATFSLKSNKGDFLVISNIDMDLWGVHLIMIKFGSKDCLTVKFSGQANYPFEVDKFKEGIPQPTTSKPTTSLPISTTIMKATTTTAAPTTKRTTTGTTSPPKTIATITAAKTTITTISSPTKTTNTTTTTAPTTKSTTTETTTPQPKTTKTTSSPTKTTKTTTTAPTTKSTTTETTTPPPKTTTTITTTTTAASTTKIITTATTSTSNTTSSNATSVLLYPKKEKNKMMIYIVVPIIALLLLLVLALILYKRRKMYKVTEVEANYTCNRTEMKDISDEVLVFDTVPSDKNDSVDVFKNELCGKTSFKYSELSSPEGYEEDVDSVNGVISDGNSNNKDLSFINPAYTAEDTDENSDTSSQDIALTSSPYSNTDTSKNIETSNQSDFSNKEDLQRTPDTAQYSDKESLDGTNTVKSSEIPSPGRDLSNNHDINQGGSVALKFIIPPSTVDNSDAKSQNIHAANPACSEIDTTSHNMEPTSQTDLATSTQTNDTSGDPDKDIFDPYDNERNKEDLQGTPGTVEYSDKESVDGTNDVKPSGIPSSVIYLSNNHVNINQGGRVAVKFIIPSSTVEDSDVTSQNIDATNSVCSGIDTTSHNIEPTSQTDLATSTQTNDTSADPDKDIFDPYDEDMFFCSIDISDGDGIISEATYHET